jgi:RNA polymerase sigma-70 factor (ECF subfamily)
MSEQLIQRWLQGDQEAAGLLYQQHRARIYRLAYALLSNEQDAEEVMQDTLTYALVNIEKYQPERAALSTWLHAIAVSRCRDRQRRKKQPTLSLGRWLGRGGDQSENQPGPEGATITKETRHALWAALDRLDVKQREAIVLRYWGGHTYREMAYILDCPLPTAQSRVRLGYERLRKLLILVDPDASTPQGETLR